MTRRDKEFEPTVVGINIHNKRMAALLTLDDLAKKTGVSRQTIHRYESGEIKNIPSDKIEIIAKALDTSPGVIMGWEDKEAGQPVESSPIPVSLEILISKLEKENLEKLEVYAKKLLDLQELENE
ncbi:transcriptional regulator with XRE-family HTH domain [Aequitasia blattaphilus]|uniref:Helix-turn-helix domain-containing protein n=1 Tax=Aequitasia blattaphilus TaxID=2949332 RepID=A0ABT1ECS0_9FIRM|nr:helix-turn-helix transcriptional regulator [Aequitasia blattaphilus]MCP1103634.1 helix-turn-helix domain-containing protein [Aequitasia blattaphilus]MCR8616274.1 helix-turn-helix domain-containing protein [Aequitasia blattaphilus]